MRFKFPLQKVMDHRKILEGMAQKDFENAAAELNKQVGILEIFEKLLKDAYEQSFQTQHAESGQTSEQLKQLHDFILGQKVRIERQKAKIQICENIVEVKREILREKAVDYKIIERLRDKKKAEFEQEMRIKEQKELDEISVLRSARRERV
jgi:flagellar protein FliJ